MTVAEGKST